MRALLNNATLCAVAAIALAVGPAGCDSDSDAKNDPDTTGAEADDGAGADADADAGSGAAQDQFAERRSPDAENPEPKAAEMPREIAARIAGARLSPAEIDALSYRARSMGLKR